MFQQARLKGNQLCKISLGFDPRDIRMPADRSRGGTGSIQQNRIKRSFVKLCGVNRTYLRRELQTLKIHDQSLKSWL